MIWKVFTVIGDLATIAAGWACLGIGFGWWNWYIEPKDKDAIILGFLILLGGQISRNHRERHEP